MADPATPATPSDKEKLLQQLQELENRLQKYKEKGMCFPAIESQMADARNLAEAGKLEDARKSYDKASQAVDCALASLTSEPLAWWLLGLETAYLVVILALGYLVERYPNYWLWENLVGYKAKAGWFGALGGVTIGLYGIYSHISAKDFDPTFKLWYICKPAMGAIFGWFVFLVYYVGVITASKAKPDFTQPELGYLVAFLAGFSERFTIKTIDRFMTVLTVGEDKSKTKDKDKPDAQNF